MKTKSKQQKRNLELLTDLAQQVAHMLVEMATVRQDVAAMIGEEVAERMALHWGGQNLYFPMGKALKLSRRDRQIYAEFNGENHSELARKFGLSLQWVYAIVKAVRQEELERRQSKLFDAGDDV